MNRRDRILAAVAEAETDADLRRAQGQARRLMEEESAKRQRLKAKKAPKDTTREDNWRTTREAVLKRASGRCELCGIPCLALDCHHLAPGAMRRKFEHPGTVIAVCRMCHRKWHDGDKNTLIDSLRVAERIGAPDIVQANLSRRIERATP